MATNDTDVKTNAAEPRAQSPAADAAGRKRDLALVSRGTYLKEKALQYLFFACAFLAVVTVVLIFAFTMMQAAPVFTDTGLANFFSFTWAPTEGHYGILSLAAGTALVTVGALVLGVSAGPASALLGFFMLDRIPEASRGSALGTQNSLLLAAAPVAVFATSVGVSALGTSVAAVVLVGCWMAITAFTLVARGMRNLDDAAPDLKREEGALEEARLDS